MLALNYISTGCSHTRRTPIRARQRGVVLLIALIILVALTLGGIALIRSTSTTNLIAGNLAFQQAAVNAAEIGSETAISYLQKKGNSLWNGDSTTGYSAVVFDPRPGESWGDFWERLKKGTDPDAKPKPMNLSLNSAEFDDSVKNYEISYVIHRLCDGEGMPSINTTYCVKPPTFLPEGWKAGDDGVLSSEVYYRITIRVDGPRNTESYIQTIVAVSA